MNICLPLCLLVLLGALVPVYGQAPAALHPHSLSLNVEPMSTGGTSKLADADHQKELNTAHPDHLATQVRTSQTETNRESEAIEISVRNFATLPDTAQVEWYFVALPVKPDAGKPVSEQQFIYDKGSKSVTLAGSASTVIPVTSAPVASEDKRKSQNKLGHGGKLHAGKNAEDSETGSVLSGWMVRIVADGKMLDARASKDQLADIVKDPAKLEAMKGH